MLSHNGNWRTSDRIIQESFSSFSFYPTATAAFTAIACRIPSWWYRQLWKTSSIFMSTNKWHLFTVRYVAQRAESDIIRTVRVTMVSSSIPPPAKAYSSNRRFEIPQLRLPFSKSDRTVNVQCSDQNRSCLLSINFHKKPMLFQNRTIKLTQMDLPNQMFRV